MKQEGNTFKFSFGSILNSTPRSTILKLPDFKSLQEAHEKQYKKKRNNVNTESHRFMEKLSSFLKKLEQENSIGNFIFESINPSEETKHKMINLEGTDSELKDNMATLYKTVKKIEIVLDHAANSTILEYKMIKYLGKLFKIGVKLLKSFGIYFGYLETNLCKDKTEFETELLNFKNQLVQKINYQIKIVLKETNINYAKKISIEEKSEDMQIFLNKLPEHIRKARLEAEEISLNEYDRKKDNLKNELNKFKEDIKIEIGSKNLVRSELNLDLIAEKFYKNKENKSSSDKEEEAVDDDFNEAMFDNMEEGENKANLFSEQSKLAAALLIQRFWRSKKKNKDFYFRPIKLDFSTKPTSESAYEQNNSLFWGAEEYQKALNDEREHAKKKSIANDTNNEKAMYVHTVLCDKEFLIKRLFKKTNSQFLYRR